MKLEKITAIHWQPALGQFGAIVTDIQDIEQCIRIILKTPKGSDPHRPEFGSDLWRYIDHPLPNVIPDIIAETVNAIRLWEPRAEVIKVTTAIEEYSQLIVKVIWQPTSDASKTFETNIYLWEKT